MEASCAQVWIVLSSCLEDDIEPALPYAIEEHIWSADVVCQCFTACEMSFISMKTGECWNSLWALASVCAVG